MGHERVPGCRGTGCPSMGTGRAQQLCVQPSQPASRTPRPPHLGWPEGEAPLPVAALSQESLTLPEAVARPLWLPVVLGRQVSSRVFLQPKCHPPVTNYLRQTQNVFLHRNYAIIPSLLALCWIALLCDFLLAVTGICLKWKKGRVCTKDPRHFMRSQFPLR